MVEKIFDDVYRIKIPLPNNPLGATNAYLIQGMERNLLIDTGFNRTACREAMDEGMQELGVGMENTDIFITHLHSDHSGLVSYLAGPETRVYSGKYSALALSKGNSGLQWSHFGDLIEQSGLLELGFSKDPSVHPGYRFSSEVFGNVTVVEDGSIIPVGDMLLHCVETTGHAPNHICLYEPERKILFSGDHILGKITPNNTIWGAPWTIGVDYLGEYLKNLDKIARLEVKLVLPGHRDLITECSKRINELKQHHKNRLDDVLTIVGEKTMNGVQIAREMKWDLTYESWEEFPAAQKMFSTGEALSHLTHLVFKGVLVKELQDGVVYYRKI